MSIETIQEIIQTLMSTPTVHALIIGVLLIILTALLIGLFGIRTGRSTGKDMIRVLDQFIDLERDAKETRRAIDERQASAVERLVTGVDALNENNKAVQYALESSGAALDMLGRRVESQHTETLAILQPIRATNDDTTRVVMELRSMLVKLEHGQENLLGIAETLSGRVAQQGEDAAELRETIAALSSQLNDYNGNMENMFVSIRSALAHVEAGA